MNTYTDIFAHSLPGRPHDEWEPLSKHLQEVADQAGAFAAELGSRELGEVVGRWHDLGKCSRPFQDYIRVPRGVDGPNAHIESRSKVDHSTFGAQLAKPHGLLGMLAAYCIAGHHAGLPDTEGDGGLRGRLTKDIGFQEVMDVITLQPQTLLEWPSLKPPPMIPACASEQAFQLAFFTRMLFSCLVDADFLCTEAFMNRERRLRRSVSNASIADLRTALDTTLAAMTAQGRGSIDQARSQILEACRSKAAIQPGFFTLTVPTGGGKTLSSMAFALRHAEIHGLRRVVVAVPFTSIIEQNADRYRRAFRQHGGALLEHHSSFEPKGEDRWSRLASENWDAPVVITTTVQLYESLFANRTSRCRKLHRLARSVIVVDEAQAIPVRLLRPTLAALHELVRNYGCTIVLCTATQPAVGKRAEFPIGLPLPKNREIVPDTSALFTELKRVDIEPVRDIPDKQLADELIGHRQALCIVYTRNQCRQLFLRISDLVGEDTDRPLCERSCLHLSTDMCAQHRAFVIRLIRRRLRLGLPCRVVSTSLIEAGVDIDFPVVFRALAGLDSIAQAAGRCNREGRLGRTGRVIVFRPESPPPSQMQDLKLAIRDAESVMRHYAGDLLHPDAIAAYFTEHYWKRSAEWDQSDVMGCFKGNGDVLNFRTAAEKYRLIDDSQTPVVVPWGRRGRVLVDALKQRALPVDREMRRSAQRYTVGLWPWALRQLQENTSVAEPQCEINGQPVGVGVQVLLNPSAYSSVIGLNADAVGVDPAWLIEGSY